MAHRGPEPPHCLEQIEVHFSLIEIPSWKRGMNTSIACSIANQLLMKILSTEFNVLLGDIPTATETKKAAFNYCLSVKAKGADAIPAESIKLDAYQ